MTSQMDTILMQSISLVNERSGRPAVLPRHSCGFQNLIFMQNLKIQKLDSSCRNSSLCSRRRSGTAFALNTDGITDNNDQGSANGDNSFLGTTRLGRIVSAGGRELLSKLNSARKNFPMKVFLLLLGFYTANALATILGQTGDWDVLVAGVVVAAIEGIGMLMYKKPMRTGRLQSLVVMINYWKAGICLGLFVDAFKLGS
ncbi:ycf20-like protein [Salvia hispanica]|uniref:ycf20-like protein n=1 Tax=Salvia hispanica TaxID=49212 RepID=UPI00200999AB|nr:ycf20-like protein [Salvia hispanica]XP_047968953.1 ycf20-like protein [Salvia hispanica]